MRIAVVGAGIIDASTALVGAKAVHMIDDAVTKVLREQEHLGTPGPLLNAD